MPENISNNTNNNPQTQKVADTKPVSADENTAQTGTKNDKLINTLGDIFKSKGVGYRVVGVVLLIILSITITVLNLSKKASREVAPQATQDTNTNDTNYNPSAELDLPTDNDGSSSNQDAKTLSDPAIIVDEFLKYNQTNDRESAKSLISPRVEKEAFSPTLEGTNNEDSLYGKNFTFDIFDTYIEVNGDLSRVSTIIQEDNTYYTLVYILLWEENNWKLLDKETYKPVGVER